MFLRYIWPLFAVLPVILMGVLIIIFAEPLSVLHWPYISNPWIPRIGGILFILFALYSLYLIYSGQI